MASADVLTEAFDRIREVVHQVADDLPPELMTVRAGDEANPIGWLLWHLTRVQDDHVADAAGTGQAWSNGWSDRFGLPYVDADTGYAHSSEQVAGFNVTSAELLLGYHDAVHDRTVDFVRSLSDSDLDRVVDEAFDPPVTLGVRLVSVIADDLQHAGQAAYLRGLLERR